MHPVKLFTLALHVAVGLSKSFTETRAGNHDGKHNGVGTFSEPFRSDASYICRQSPDGAACKKTRPEPAPGPVLTDTPDAAKLLDSQPTNRPRSSNVGPAEDIAMKLSDAPSPEAATDHLTDIGGGERVIDAGTEAPGNNELGLTARAEPISMPRPEHSQPGAVFKESTQMLQTTVVTSTRTITSTHTLPGADSVTVYSYMGVGPDQAHPAAAAMPLSVVPDVARRDSKLGHSASTSTPNRSFVPQSGFRTVTIPSTAGFEAEQ
jgi:hypothetical protein